MRSQHEVLVAIKDVGVPLTDHSSVLMSKCDSEYVNFIAAYLGWKRKDREVRRRDDREDQEEVWPTQPTFPESQLTVEIPMIEAPLHRANWGHGAVVFHAEAIPQEMSQPILKHEPKRCAKKSVDEKVEGLFEIWFKANDHLYENLIEERNEWYDITYEIFRLVSPESWLLNTVIDAYAHLLITRESTRDPTNYYLPVYFYPSIKRIYDEWLRKRNKQHELLEVKTTCPWFFMDYKGQGPITDKKVIFMPMHVSSNRFVLFAFYVELWKVILIDPLNQDTIHAPRPPIQGDNFLHSIFSSSSSILYANEGLPKRTGGILCIPSKATTTELF